MTANSGKPAACVPLAAALTAEGHRIHVKDPKTEHCRCCGRGRWRRRTRAVAVFYFRLILLMFAAIMLAHSPTVIYVIGALASAVLVLTGLAISWRAISRTWKGVDTSRSRQQLPHVECVIGKPYLGVCRGLSGAGDQRVHDRSPDAQDT